MRTLVASGLICGALLTSPAHAGRLGQLVRRVIPGARTKAATKQAPRPSAWDEHNPMVDAVRRDNLPIYGLSEFNALARVAKIGADGKLEVTHPNRPLATSRGYRGEGMLPAGKVALEDTRTVLEDMYAHHVDAMLGKITQKELWSRINRDHAKLEQITHYARRSGNVDDKGNFSPEAWSQVMHGQANFAAAGVPIGGEMGRLHAGVPYTVPSGRRAPA